MHTNPVAPSPFSVGLLTRPGRHPLLPAGAVNALGKTIVVAPHPDDETLGCGGLLALLADRQSEVQVIIMTDGSRSHPASRHFPAARIAAIREQESLSALALLNVAATQITFLRYPDGQLPSPDDSCFSPTVARLQATLMAVGSPDTVIVPWRGDPHSDHQATWHIVVAALAGLALSPRWLEYPVWAWPKAEGLEGPTKAEANVWRVDITDVLDRKRRAITMYRSQLGELIDDDPTGFVLTPTMRRYFEQSWELYLVPHRV